MTLGPFEVCGRSLNLHGFAHGAPRLAGHRLLLLGFRGLGEV